MDQSEAEEIIFSLSLETSYDRHRNHDNMLMSKEIEENYMSLESQNFEEDLYADFLY